MAGVKKQTKVVPIKPKRPLPTVAIVGRPNVGKSSLLNALVRKRISIVQDMPGVTRDRVNFPLEVDGRFIDLVDTGGYGYHDEQGLTEHIKHQIEIAMTRADMVVFVVDVTAGVTTPDNEIAMLLRKKGIPTLVLANKADGPKADAGVAEFAQLGFGEPLGVSATNARNLDQIVDAIGRRIDLTDAPREMPDPAMHIAIVGKRNAGKSSFVNAIAKLFEGDPQRVIVSEVPGTTRDSVDVRFEKDGKSLVVIDTAGVRKKRQMVSNDVEFYSFHRAERSIRRADVVLFLIDATQPISEPDKKLAGYIAEQYKPVILVFNKWDLARQSLIEQTQDADERFQDADAMEKYRKYVDLELRHLDYAPMAFTTASDGKNIQAVIDLCQHLNRQANERLTTGRLNNALEAVLQERAPSAPKGKRPRVYYATQVAVAPPTLVLFVNKAEYIDENYKRFVVNRFRDLLPYPEVPIKLQVRGKAVRDPATAAGERRPGKRPNARDAARNGAPPISKASKRIAGERAAAEQIANERSAGVRSAGARSPGVRGPGVRKGAKGTQPGTRPGTAAKGGKGAKVSRKKMPSVN